MTKIHVFFVVCMMLPIILAACGSGSAANNSGSTGAVAGSDAVSPGAVSPGAMIAITPVTTDVVTLVSTDVVTPQNGSSMRVLWTISSYVIGKNSSMDATSAQAMLFKGLDINDTAITFDGTVCQSVTFLQSTVNAADYLSSTWQITPAQLGIDVTELQVFKTNCSLPGFQEYMRLADGRLIVPIKGIFFFFTPAVTY